MSVGRYLGTTRNENEHSKILQTYHDHDDPLPDQTPDTFQHVLRAKKRATLSRPLKSAADTKDAHQLFDNITLQIYLDVDHTLLGSIERESTKM